MTKHLMLIVAILISPIVLSAQAHSMSFIKKYNNYLPAESLPIEQFVENLALEANIQINDFVLDQSQEINHTQHLKYKQYYKGLEVIGSNYHIHAKEGNVYFSNGHLHPNITLGNMKVSLSLEEAQSIIKEKILREYALEESPFINEADDVMMTTESSKLVVVDRSYPNQSGQYKLAHYIQIEVKDPYDKRIVLVDVESGKIIHDQSIVCTFGVEGKGKTRFYGEQTFIVDSISPNQFKLHDPIRDITTYSARTGDTVAYYDTDNYWDLTNENQDEVALDAHFCTSKFYDMMNDLFGWKGLNGTGLGFNPVVHANQGRAYLNAFWNGQNAFFGNGDCHHNPLTVFSVVGHEFMHGITDYTSDLIYANESGGINESMSDIFGKSLEYFYDNERFTWELGPEFANSQYSSSFRSMVTPNKYEDPAYYRGEFWDFNNAVHTNSGVFNHWFYLMVDGKNGINEKGISYDVRPMPIEEVLQVVFLTQRAYLTPSSTYPELHLLTLEAVKELYGEASPMMNSVTEAWKAVGLPYENDEQVYDLEPLVLDLIQTTCYQDHDYDINFEIINVGTKPTKIGDTLYVRLAMSSVFDTILEIVMQDVLNTSESLSVSLPGFFNVNETKTYFFRCEILNEDDVNDNNFDFGFFRNFMDTEPTVILSSNGLQYVECFSPYAEGFFTLANRSCAIIPEGTPYDIIVRSGLAVVHEQSYIFERELLSGASRQINYSIDELYLTEDITIEIVTFGDIKTDNTLKNTTFRELKMLDESYFNGFEDLSVTQDLTTYNIRDNALIEYNSEPFLGVYGAYQGETRVPCPDKASNLDEIGFGQAGISGCLDLTSMMQPHLSFDLVQFRYNETDYPELEQNAALVRVRAKDQSGWVVDDLISNQLEAIIMNKSYDLPPNFKGSFEIEFFAHRAPRDTPDPLDYDANIIDNLTIEDVTSVNGVIDRKLLIYPNPVQSFIRLIADEVMKEVQIINSSGGGASYSMIQNKTIDISHLPSSVYIIKAISVEGNHYVAKFVKL